MSLENLDGQEPELELTDVDPDAIPNEVKPEDVTGLKETLRKVRDERNTLAKLQKEWAEKAKRLEEKFSQVNPDEYEQLKAQSKKLEEYEAVLKDRINAAKLEYKAKEEELTKKAQAQVRHIENLVLEQKLLDLYYAAGGKKDGSWKAGFLNQFKGKFALEYDSELPGSDAKIVLLGDNGEKAIATDPMEFIQGLREHQDSYIAEMFEKHKPSGTGGLFNRFAGTGGANLPKNSNEMWSYLQKKAASGGF